MRETQRRSIAERVRLVEEWQASGVSLQAFSAVHGVPPSSLSRWAIAVRQGQPLERPRAARRREARAPIGPVSFREVAPAVAGPCSDSVVRITLRSGTVLEFSTVTEAAYVAVLVRALDGLC